MPSSRAEAGGQLLQELEALSKALYKAQSMPPSSSSVETGIPPPRRDFEGRSSHRRVSEVGSRPTTKLPSGGLDSRHSISMINPAKIKADDDNKDKASEFPEWLEDNLAFSQNLEAPLQKRSIWDWKPIRALAHIGQQRFHCEFSAHVHGIEKLPSSMNGLRLQVHLRHHKDTGLHTIPARAAHGSVEFEETLHFRCNVYGSKKSSGTIKYMAKSFTLFVAAPDVAELDLGKHRLDLSRILPSTTTTTPGANPSWNTSFKLSGKAKGSSLWITFGYEIPENNKKHVGSSSSRFSPSPTSKTLRSFNSLPNSPQTSMLRAGRKPSSVVDFGSPAVSESGNDFSDFRIEHLSLDEPDANDDARVQNVKSAAPRLKFNSLGAFDLRGRPLFPQIDAYDDLAPSTQDHIREPVEEEDHREENNAEEEDDDNLEDDAVDFNVIEQGVETSPLNSNSSTTQEQQEHAIEEDVGSMDDHSQSHQEQEKEEANVHYQESQVENVEFEEEVEPEQPTASEVVDGHHIASGYESEGLEVTALNVQEEEEEVVHQYESIAQFQKEEPTEREDNEVVHWQDKIQEATDWKQSEVGRYELKADEWKNEDENDGMYLLEALEIDGLNEAPEGQQEADVNSNKAYDDDEVELVEGEFLDMLGEPTAAATVADEESDDEPDSPRALLFKQFEQEAMLEGGFGVELDNEELQLSKQQEEQEEQFVSSLNEDGDAWNSEEETELVAIMDAAELELQKATQAMKSKARAKMLEDAEAEALLHQWGLNENVFHNNDSEGMDVCAAAAAASTNELMILKQELPPLAPGLSTSVTTRDGGSLRSMNPVHFQGGKNEGRLVMHASKPVVVPTEKGSTALDVLRNLAAGGTESMAVEAMGAMPLEDITGKSVHQIAVEGQACLERRNQRYALEYGSSSTGGSSGALATQSSNLGLYPKQKKGANIHQQQDDCLSLDELAPVAMEKIEALAMQGLKIQCEMAEDAAPYTIDPVSSQDLPRSKGRSNKMGMPLLKAPNGESSESEAAAGDGLISMSLSLDEWMRLDAGLYDEEEEANDKTLAILDAHRAAHTTTDLVLNLDGENDNKEGSKSSGKMGNTLTLAMLVQLRDPLRNYEPVGAPMMALIEAERVVLPPRPKLWKRVAFKGNSEVDEEEVEMGGGHLQQAQFKITAVHMAGLKPNEDAKDSNKKNVWCSQKQQQSGSRWLIANGMGKTSTAKHPLLKSKANNSGSKEKQGESLWSISFRGEGGGMKALPAISRNPDVKFGKMQAGFKKPW